MRLPSASLRAESSLQITVRIVQPEGGDCAVVFLSVVRENLSQGHQQGGGQKNFYIQPVS